MDKPADVPKKVKNGTADKVDAKQKNFDHLRSAAKQRLALAKAKMQENMKTKENGLHTNGTCKDRDSETLTIC